jgi:hypothetical protein
VSGNFSTKASFIASRDSPELSNSFVLGITAMQSTALYSLTLVPCPMDPYGARYVISKSAPRQRSMMLKLVSATSLSEKAEISFAENSEKPSATVRGEFDLAVPDTGFFNVFQAARIKN